MERILPANTEFKGVPYVGCAATIPVGSDSYPGTVSWVSPQTVDVEWKDRNTGEMRKLTIPRRIRVRGVQSRGAEGWNNAYTENQKYVYYDNGEETEDGEEYSWRPRAKRYVRVGTNWRSTAAQGVGFGYRAYYRDPHF